MAPRGLVVLIALILSCPAFADEGMWLPNKPPRELLKSKYQFDLTDTWLEKVQKASIRFNNGGSGSFVSPDGLVVTNHHIGADALQKLSTKGKDLYHDGFLARTRADELKCPDLELNVLEEIEDVTKQVQDAVKDGASAADAAAARRAAIARIARESTEKTRLRSDVVTLFHGGLYHLYRYKKFTDIRLVMAPEHGIAFFGGDSDNFEYPRWNLDVCFFRVYENGEPLRTKHWFRWNAEGPKEGDLVFVSGHPGTTNRLETVARLKHRRDFTLPYALQTLRCREALLSQYAEKGPEQRRNAMKDLFPVANARKALTGQHQGLLDPAILVTKEKLEQSLIDAFEADKGTIKVSPWKMIAVTQEKLRGFERDYFLLERGDAFDSKLLRTARHLLRLADELPKEDGKRLPEYRSSALESLKFQLFSPAPISFDLERVKLAGSLSFLAENLGGEHPLVRTILDGKSPAKRAEELIAGSKLADPQERKRLFSEGKPAIDASGDPLIALVRTIDEQARALRQKYDESDEVQQQAYASISRMLFEKFGDRIAPDATFTLRLAFGAVQGYEVDGASLPYATDFAGLFARGEEQGQRDPFAVPQRWLDAKAKLDLKTPFNFVSTADTIGGNSGSPVLNRAGELVGINFDRNRHGLVRNFVYTDYQARHISVHSKAVLEALRKIYAADELVRELVK
ncbi:MAG: S46 family peptidase [Gemmataceae bacterium]|nr:S46 family peptidase [Gemmataceae bacterium]